MNANCGGEWDAREGFEARATCAKSEMPTVMVSPSSFAHSCDFAYFSPSSTARDSKIS